MSNFDWAKYQSTVGGVVETLKKKEISARHLRFGGEGQEPTKKITIPTDARSEFLANRAMGDWAEAMLSAAVREAFPNMMISQYGNTDRIAAGHPDFKKRYLAGVGETQKFGKRPDLLLFQNSTEVAEDISELPLESRNALVKQALAALEVRSSKFEALTYMQVRKAQSAAGKKGIRVTPSFTVKIEDLIIVFRWLERYQIPQAYW